MEKSQEIQPETESKPKIGDQFYSKAAVDVSSPSGQVIITLDPSWTIKINNIMPDGSYECWFKDPDHAFCFPISQEDFEALPLDRDTRKGPVSAENPMSLERAQQLLSKEKRCEMRGEELVPEQQVRDLMLEALERVQQEKDEPFTKDYEKPADQ